MILELQMCTILVLTLSYHEKGPVLDPGAAGVINTAISGVSQELQMCTIWVLTLSYQQGARL